MHTISLNKSSNMMAKAGSIAIHAFVAAWFLSSTTQVEIMPQQMIEVTLVAAPSAEPIQQKPVPATPPSTPEKVQHHAVRKLEITSKESPRSMQKEENPPLAQAAQVQELAALSPAAGHSANTKETEQLVMTKPLFDAAYLQNPAPEYPAHAKRRNMEGTVMLDVVVSQAGAARSVDIAKSSGFAVLDESAKHAVSRWKFVPAKRGGETVEARVMVPIEFRLE
jgi:protein TonB